MLFLCYFRGVGAMELVAMEMKLRGMYIARQLSFQGVTFRIEDIPLEENFVKCYNKSVQLVCFNSQVIQTYTDNIIHADKIC